MTATAKQNEWAKVGEDVRAVNTSSDFTPDTLNAKWHKVAVTDQKQKNLRSRREDATKVPPSLIQQNNPLSKLIDSERLRHPRGLSH